MQVVLFDMDGTLTKHRQVITQSMCRKLKELLKIARVGIVSGSKFDDIYRQCQPLWDTITDMRLDNLTLLPCNGTQSYFWVDGIGWRLEYNNMMSDKIGAINYQKLIREITFAQVLITNNDSYLGKFEIEHDFIDARGSLVNWCPIGRSSTKYARSNFVSMDKEKNIRTEMINTLNLLLSRSGFDCSSLTIAKGGQTSVDIFPKGWDKTFVMKRYHNTNDCWFIGDACEKGQNDYELYTLLSNYNRAYKTTGPSHTLKIIDSITDFINKTQG